MTPEELSPQERRAVQDSNRELERIADKYRHNRILDDGRSDALKYAVVQHQYARTCNDNTEIERWFSAIDDATRPDAADWKRLREQIEWEGEGFMETDGADEKWIQYGLALLNLADSI